MWSSMVGMNGVQYLPDDHEVDLCRYRSLVSIVNHLPSDEILECSVIASHDNDESAYPRLPMLIATTSSSVVTAPSWPGTRGTSA